MASIQITIPNGQAYTYQLAGERFTVGRGEDNSITIADESVSTNHGEFSFDGNQWAFYDLGSTNGTKVDGNRVESLALAPGSQFEIGDCVVDFYEEEEAAATTPAGNTARRAAALSNASAGGYGDQPINRSMRVGFGAKKKEPDGGRSILMILGVIALIAILAITVMFLTQGLV
jgi:pSer/pThr/pTyr-binding forkhead associated (FHA) protein